MNVHNVMSSMSAIVFSSDVYFLYCGHSSFCVSVFIKIACIFHLFFVSCDLFYDDMCEKNHRFGNNKYG